MALTTTPWPTLLLLLLLISRSASEAPADADALLKFKGSLGNTAALDNWATGSAPCPGGNGPRWTGVLCSNSTLWGLQLENMGLTGVIDLDSLTGLKDLRTISFANNSFDGPIPNISKIGFLKSVFLASNEFSGVIPADAFARMGSLKKVNLSFNQFSGPIPASLAAAPRLLELMLDHNMFEGRIPEFRQQTLKTVDLSNNDLEGPIPASLNKMGAASFADNKDLCGKPLENKCPSPQKVPTAAVIVLIVLGVALALGVVGVVFALLLRRRNISDSDDVSSSSRMKTVSSEEDKLERGSPEYQGSSSKKQAKEHHDHGKLVFLLNDREQFELHDLLKASAEVLGSGSFGSSYKAVLWTGPAMVVKRFRDMNGVGKEEFQEHMRRLGRLRHPNLLPLVAFYYRKEDKLLVTDFIDNGSLVQILHANRTQDRPALDWPARLRIIKGVGRALTYLHKELQILSLPHGHLKSSNVLLGENYEPHLTDYGLAPVMSKEAAKQLLVSYKSPEFMQYSQVNKKSDVWSLGILILEILTGKFPTNYLPQGKAGAGADLAQWVNMIVKEESTDEVFDKDMEGTKNGEGEMLSLLQIGLNCCKVDVEKRWELTEAVEKIEELRESGNEDSSLASEGDIYSSTVATKDDFS